MLNAQLSHATCCDMLFSVLVRFGQVHGISCLV